MLNACSALSKKVWLSCGCEIATLQGFYQQQPAYRLASDLDLEAKTITRVCQRLRMVLFHIAELEGAKLSGESEIDESYFGGARKGQRGRGARGKSIIFGLLERYGRGLYQGGGVGRSRRRPF